MKATKEQIIAEANRRRAEHGEGAPPVEHYIVDVVCENWIPPEPVDPDVWAFLEWWGSEDGNANPKHAYLAGARMAREQERERSNHPIAFAVRVMARVFKDLDHAEREARAALAKYRGEAQ